MGQVIHDKFIVIDFNGDNPLVFTGSSNLADGGETQNGDNLLGFSDPVVARVFATEAVRLCDHYYFRAAVSQATDVKPLMLTACGGQPKWWQTDYDPTSMRNVQRLLFADGPSAVTSVPSGVSVPANAPPAPATPTKTPAKKTTPTPKAPSKAPAKTAAKAKPAPKPKVPAKAKPSPKPKPKAKPAAKPKPKPKAKAPAKAAKKKAAPAVAKKKPAAKKAAKKATKSTTRRR